MQELITNFPGQLTEAINIARKATLIPATDEIRNVVISGLGGSGIGGTIAAELTSGDANVPLTVNKDYVLPEFVDKHSLVIICSYSGNTEETISALEKAIYKEAKITCITSGGKILGKANDKGFDSIVIPGGMPPRACLGYSLTQLFAVLQFHNIVQEDYVMQLEGASELLKTQQEEIVNKAGELTGQLYGKIPVIYCASGSEGVAVRFRQQLNENAKMLCWHHVLPEMNHNELVGWTQQNDDLAVIIFRNEHDFDRTQKRFDISKGIFGRYTSTVLEVYSRGKTVMERAMYLIHLGDWVSYLLAEKKKIDAVEVKVIDHLKGELAKI